MLPYYQNRAGTARTAGTAALLLVFSVRAYKNAPRTPRTNTQANQKNLYKSIVYALFAFRKTVVRTKKPL